MAFTIRFDGPDAEALQREAEAEGVTVEDLARGAVREHLARRPSTDLAAELAAVRADVDFNERLDRLIERDQGILDRLAE